MKKKIILLMGMAICAFGIVAFINSPKSEKSKEMLMLNIEALADGELPSTPMHCVEYGNQDCPIGYIKVKYIYVGWSLTK